MYSGCAATKFSRRRVEGRRGGNTAQSFDRSDLGEPEERGKAHNNEEAIISWLELFFWSYVHGLSCCSPEKSGDHYIRSKCWASQKKNESYQQECILRASMNTYGLEVMYAHCTCPTGIFGDCHHLVAVLLTCEYCVQKQQDPPGGESVTTQRQRWGPRPREVVSEPVMDISLEKASVRQAESQDVEY